MRQLVNARILTEFVQSAIKVRAIPLIVYLPSRGSWGEKGGNTPLAKKVLQTTGLVYLDPSPRLAQLDPADRYLVIHYSPRSNAAVAKCLTDPVREALGQACDGENMSKAR
jgi:hypothetical protein